ncbi:MAG TPA: sialidase family protein, partial [Blastocatellia bacterium]|nr:sialidase family protein [Blastocatellia bacterium]
LPLTKNLSKSKGEAFGPSLAINMTGKTRAYATYHDTSPGTTQAFLVKSKKGSKFKKAANITPHDGGAFSPRVAVDSNEQVNVVWGDTLEVRKRVVFLRSLDQGATFSEPVDISRSSGDAFEPEIAVDKDNAINVAWEDTATGTSLIMFTRSTDAGESFSEPVRVSSPDARATEANIAVDSLGNIHVVWVGASGDTLQAFYARSTDGGTTFSEPVNLSQVEGADIHKLVIATFNENVYVAYNNEANNSRQVFLVKSKDSGLSFSDPVRVSNADRAKGRAHSPALAVDSTGLLHIVWIDSSVVGQDEGLLFYSNSTNGNKFSTQQLILAALP